mgnify:CR=1 FL=1
MFHSFLLEQIEQDLAFHNEDKFQHIQNKNLHIHYIPQVPYKKPKQSLPLKQIKSPQNESVGHEFCILYSVKCD